MRQGAAAVEAPICLLLLLLFVLGVREVGRVAQVQQILSDAAHEGARLASLGLVNQTPITTAVVQQKVRDHMTSAGLPGDAVSGAQIQFVNKSAHAWTDPIDAQPLDAFQITITIPSGNAFDSLRWILLPSITGTTEISATTNWVSMNDPLVAVDAPLTYEHMGKDPRE